MKKLFLGLLTCILGLMISGWLLVPTFNSWHSTPEELAATYPGDAYIASPVQYITRAITIDAPVEEVFPWLVQMGQGRGGFYSYDGLENLFGLDIHSADRIEEAWQDLEPGEQVRLHPEGGMIVADIFPCRYLILTADEGTMTAGARQIKGEVAYSWAFYLFPEEEHQTRLVARSAYHFQAGWKAWWAFQTVSILSWVMEEKMLRGIRDRAERHYTIEAEV